jgi:hypothetical protein
MKAASGRFFIFVPDEAVNPVVSFSILTFFLWKAISFCQYGILCK